MGALRPVCSMRALCAAAALVLRLPLPAEACAGDWPRTAWRRNAVHTSVCVPPWVPQDRGSCSPTLRPRRDGQPPWARLRSAPAVWGRRPLDAQRADKPSGSAGKAARGRRCIPISCNYALECDRKHGIAHQRRWYSVCLGVHDLPAGCMAPPHVASQGLALALAVCRCSVPGRGSVRPRRADRVRPLACWLGRS